MTTTKTFHLTEDLVKLLRGSYVSWDFSEFGAAQIDPKRPYGNSDVELDIAEMLDWPINDEFEVTEDQILEATSIHKDTETALQVVLSTGSFQPGVYVSGNYGSTWTREGFVEEDAVALLEEARELAAQAIDPDNKLSHLAMADLFALLSES